MTRERPRQTSWWAKTWRWLKRLGRGLFFLVMGGVALVGALIGIANILDFGETVYSGTFIEHRCEGGGRHGCRSIGTWVSDDGNIRLEDVYLDGDPAPDGTSEASYQPTGVFNDADNNIVHGPFATAIEPLVPWALVALGLGSSVAQWWRWRGTWK